MAHDHRRARRDGPRLTSLQADGLANKDSFVSKPDSVIGEEVLARHFPAGAGQPVIVISKAGEGVAVRSAFAGAAGVAEVAEPVVKDGYAYLEGTLTDPPDSKAARDTVGRVRAAVHEVPGADAKVGGDTALVLDTQRASRHDNNLIIPIVLVVVFVILAALGISALAFEYLFGFKGADPSLPLFVFVFLVALGIDYNIFLMTRVQEESRQHGTRRGALIGLAATGGVITSAGLVLAGTFAVLTTLPLVAFAEMGFAVAVGVLLDTIVVRAILVTALNLDIGRWMWWPSRLTAKRDVEVEESDDLGEAALVR